MKNIRIFCLLVSFAGILLLAGGCKGNKASKQESLEVMSFNIRLDVPSDSTNNWSARKDNVCEMLASYQPDLLGMQEVLHSQLEDLKQGLPQYTVIGVARDDGMQSGEYCPIFFNTERFELLDQGNFSLSEQPDVFGIKGWDASYNRIATWVILRDKTTNGKLAYFNTHLDNDGQIARREGISLILKKMQELAPGLPIILTGDFNCTPQEEPSQCLEEASMKSAIKVAETTDGPSWSFHDFGRLALEDRPMLDYIYVTKHVQVRQYRNIEDRPETGYYSDHNPVMAELIVK